MCNMSGSFSPAERIYCVLYIASWNVAKMEDIKCWIEIPGREETSLKAQNDINISHTHFG